MGRSAEGRSSKFGGKGTRISPRERYRDSTEPSVFTKLVTPASSCREYSRKTKYNGQHHGQHNTPIRRSSTRSYSSDRSVSDGPRKTPPESGRPREKIPDLSGEGKNESILHVLLPPRKIRSQKELNKDEGKIILDIPTSEHVPSSPKKKKTQKKGCPPPSLKDNAPLPSFIRQRGVYDEENTSAKFEPRTLVGMQALVRFKKELNSATDIHSLDTLFTAYRALPTPRMHYLKTDEINLLLARFMSAPVRTDILMMCYLSILDDVRFSKLPISRKEWIAAISYVGQRFNLKIGIPEIESALKMWDELEKQVGAELGPTLFNILLDMAAKGGKAGLINRILAEMRRRGIHQDRYTRTTLIHWFGTLKDVATVRHIFTELVEHGEVVDTVVYNALISALMRSGEFNAAELVFQKMMMLGQEYLSAHRGQGTRGADPIFSPISPSRDPVASHQLGRRLISLAEAHRKEFGSELRPYPASRAAAIYSGPNVVTFNIFLHSYCRNGHFDDSTRLLELMKQFNVSVEPSIFISLFRGFTLHGEGRGRFSKWTRERLEEYYAAFLRDVNTRRQRHLDNILLSTVLACEIIKAFAVTTLSKARTVEVYENIVDLYARGRGMTKEMDPVVKRVVQAAIGGPLGGESADPPPSDERKKTANTDPNWLLSLKIRLKHQHHFLSKIGGSENAGL